MLLLLLYYLQNNLKKCHRAGGPVVSTLANALSPLYFEVTEAMEVMATEEPCDVACKFGDGLLAIEDYPQGFPRPGKTHCLYLLEISHFHFPCKRRLLVNSHCDHIDNSEHYFSKTFYKTKAFLLKYHSAWSI